MAVCPHCYSREMVRHGKYKGKQRWYCLKCKRTTLEPRQRVPKGYGS
jgi:transposase-like protein